VLSGEHPAIRSFEERKNFSVIQDRQGGNRTVLYESGGIKKKAGPVLPGPA
jgi:hypothetical protein